MVTDRSYSNSHVSVHDNPISGHQIAFLTIPCCSRRLLQKRKKTKIYTDVCNNMSLVCICMLTLCLLAFAQLHFGLSIGSEPSLGVEFVRHGSSSNYGLEGTCALGHVLLRVEEDHVHLWHVEQSKGHRGTEAHRDGQRGRLNVHLQGKCTTGTYTISLSYILLSFWRMA